MTEPRFGHRLISKMAPWKSNIEDVRQNLHDAAAKAKAHAHDMKVELKCVDLKIQFIGASGLPKMDVVGTADPFFTADIDGQIKYMWVFVPVIVFSLFFYAFKSGFREADILPGVCAILARIDQR